MDSETVDFQLTAADTSIKMEAGLASKRVWCKPAYPSEHCIRLNPSGYTMNPERFMESDNLTFASDIVVQIMDVQGSTVRVCSLAKIRSNIRGLWNLVQLQLLHSWIKIIICANLQIL